MSRPADAAKSQRGLGDAGGGAGSGSGNGAGSGAGSGSDTAATRRAAAARTRREGAVRTRPAALLILLIRGYQRFLSPLLGPRCRFVPSCSEYAAEALASYGALRGLGLTGWRLLRCQPFCRGGYDPVPAPRGRRVAPGPAPSPAAPSPAAPAPSPEPRDWPTGSLARPARKGPGVRHNGAHGGRADVATSERGGGPDGVSGPPGRGDSTC